MDVDDNNYFKNKRLMIMLPGDIVQIPFYKHIFHQK